MPTALPPKKEVMLALLERSSVFVHLDPRREDVRVPPWFKKQAQLVLQVGLNMAVPIPDLSVDDDSVSCTLSFSRSPHFCYVPWSAVFALVGDDSRGMVWPNDIPPEVAAQSEKRKREGGKARLKAVPDEQAASEENQALPATPPSPAGAASRGNKKRRPLSAVPPSPGGEPSPAVAVAPSDGSAEEAGGAPPPEQAATAAEKPDPGDAETSQNKSKRPPYLRLVK